jgi:hypothetical protein
MGATRALVGSLGAMTGTLAVTGRSMVGPVVPVARRPMLNVQPVGPLMAVVSKTVGKTHDCQHQKAHEAGEQ